jgi:hypothetical protein
MNYKEQITTLEKKVADLEKQLQGQQQANEFIGCNTDINILEFHSDIQRKQIESDRQRLKEFTIPFEVRRQKYLQNL